MMNNSCHCRDLINEPRCEGCNAALKEWISQMAAHAKSLTSQMVSFFGVLFFVKIRQKKVRLPHLQTISIHTSTINQSHLLNVAAWQRTEQMILACWPQQHSL
jgi:hypothetical protein